MTKYLVSTLKSYAANYSGLPVPCWQAIALTFINAISIGVCFFLSLYFVDVLHISVAAVGMLISCYGLGTVIGGVVGGKLSDKAPPKSIAIISLILQSFAFLLLVKIKSIECLMINLFVLGMAAYGFKTSNNVRVLNQCKLQPELRLRAIGITHVALNLGLGLSGVLIGELSKYGFENIFYISGSLLLISAMYLSFQKDEQVDIEKNHRGDKASDVGEIKNISEKANTQIIAVVLVCVFLVGMIIAQLSATYPIYVQNAFPQLGIKAVSLLFILDTTLIVLFQAPLANLINKYNKIYIVGLGAFMMGLGMMVLSISNIFTLALISCVIWTTGEMLFMSTAQLICYEKGSVKKKGQNIGIFQAIYATSCVIGPAVGGLIYQRLGGNVLWYISFAIGMLCFFACLSYRKYY